MGILQNLSTMASQQQAALVSVGPGSSLPWPVVDAFLQHAGQQPSSLVFFNPHADASSAPGVFGAAGLTCVAAPFSRGHNRAAFAAFATALAPGARLCVFDPQRDVARSQDISKDLLLSGFTDSSVHECSGTVLIQASKPKWDVGAKAMLKRPVAATTATTTATPAIAPLAPKTWGVNVDDNDELMDDEELLTEEDKKPVDAKAAAAASGCATSKKACKNCSCGRAELELQQEQGVKLTTDMLENPVSACGSCYLGDAFRCASCPYKGLPAFEPGKKIELSKDLLVADV